MNPLTEKIKSIAFELGFSTVGITAFCNIEEGERQLQEWIDEGRHGSMKYLEDYKKRQENFSTQISSPKNVIVLGVNYYSTQQSSSEKKLSGRIARYAWGRDYHEVIKEKHDALIQKLHEMISTPFEAVSCIDTKPILERAAGVMAGLGFVGKNTMLLSREYGPWLFLSEIVTDLDLEFDDESKGSCGSCVKCQDVCPTGALDEDYRIDARKCIAYLTIEHKGVIPRDLRSQMKDWVFGCDECLTVCPFTSHQKDDAWPELQAAAGVGTTLSFDDLFEVRSNREHKERFRGSALLRANRKQLMRNACIVLGNSDRKEAIPYLKKALQDTSALVRLHAAWGLGNLKYPDCRELLRAQEQRELDEGVLEEIREALR